jgi:hypothetical protein
MHALAGQGAGTFAGHGLMVDAGQSVLLKGTADLVGLGQVSVMGTVSGLGFVAMGHAQGMLLFTNAAGSVAVTLEGPLQTGFSPLPEQFSYHVDSGTGAYAHLHDDGTLTLDLHTAPIGPAVGSFFPFPQGTFTLNLDNWHHVPPKVTSGIEGVALLGPLVPVETPGVSDFRPLAGAVIAIESANGGHEIARVTTGVDGHFKVALPPGTYRVVPLQMPGSLFPIPEGPQTVVVHAGQFASVTVFFDTGIA